MDNSTYINPEQLAANSGTTITKMIGDNYLKSTVPACCKHKCTVEPDGNCKHGNPSILVALNVV